MASLASSFVARRRRNDIPLPCLIFRLAHIHIYVYKTMVDTRLGKVVKANWICLADLDEG